MQAMLNRRSLIQAGALSGLGLSLTDLLAFEAQSKEAAATKKSAIFLYLDGGQSHLDTWDMKPDGGEIAGEFRPMATELPGAQVCEHMTRLSKQMKKMAVLRGVKDAIGVHGRGMRLVRSGNRPRASLEHPDLGSVICKEHRSPRGVPPFVSLPIRQTNSTLETPGFLGVAYRAFAINDNPAAENFSVRALQAPNGMSLNRVAMRTALMKQLDNRFQNLDPANENLSGMNRFYQQALDILRSPLSRKAFDLAQEPDAIRDRYGRTGVGQACLLARRLIEAGVRCVTIDFGGWDTHRDNFKSLKTNLLPPWDAALAALLEDLHDRGLLETTVVWSTGEMGRTPTINKTSGRDHWGSAMSMVLAGGGIKGGQILGKTDAKGAEVTQGGCSPEDVAATVLHALGIDHKKEYHTATGRPIQIVRDGRVLRRLF